jgi:SAM-dependent methyltransferase
MTLSLKPWLKNYLAADNTAQLRRAEFDLVAPFLKGASQLLEIGGGDGFQQTLLTTICDSVVSIDVKVHPRPIAPVQQYNGRTIPFPNRSFDRIFSSNVLEHVEDIDHILAEMRRVLTDHGYAVHVLPTPAWRLWTTATHYPALPKILLSNLNNLRVRHREIGKAPLTHPSVGSAAAKRYFKFKWIGSVLVSQRHGERGNRFTEAFYYREHWWRDRFARSGWSVIDSFPTRLYYSGNQLLATGLSLAARRRLSHVLGSATRAFVLQKRQL